MQVTNDSSNRITVWCNSSTLISFNAFTLHWARSVLGCVTICRYKSSLQRLAVAARHQGTPGQMTWLEDPPPWLLPYLMLCFASVILWTENENFTISDRWPLYFDSETISAALAAFVFWGRQLKKGRHFSEEKIHPGDLARGCSDLEMTWLLCCAGAAIAVVVSNQTSRLTQLWSKRHTVQCTSPISVVLQCLRAMANKG